MFTIWKTGLIANRIRQHWIARCFKLKSGGTHAQPLLTVLMKRKSL